MLFLCQNIRSENAYRSSWRTQTFYFDVSFTGIADQSSQVKRRQGRNITVRNILNLQLNSLFDFFFFKNIIKNLKECKADYECLLHMSIYLVKRNEQLGVICHHLIFGEQRLLSLRKNVYFQWNSDFFFCDLFLKF